MKTYEEMAESALRRIEAQKNEQNRRRNKAMRIAVPAVGFCMAALIGVGIWQSGIMAKLTDAPEVAGETAVKAAESGTQAAETAEAKGENKPEEQAKSGETTASDTPATSDSRTFMRWKNMSVTGELKAALEKGDGQISVIAEYRPTTANITDFIFDGSSLAEWAIRAYTENTAEAAEKYALAFAAYADEIMPSVIFELGRDGITCERIDSGKLLIIATADEFENLPIEHSSWLFDLAED